MSIKSQITTAHEELKAHLDARLDRIEVMLQPAKPEPPEPPDVYPLPISALDLPTQQENALIAAGHETIGDLDDQTDADLMDIDGVGKRTVEFVRHKTRELSTGAW